MELPKETRLIRELAEHRSAEFVEDGEKRIITCSNCKEELVEIWFIRPDTPLKTHITVDCPLCGDKSFKQTIDGQYCVGQLESGKVLMTSMPTKVETTPEGILLQIVRIKTEKGDNRE